MIFPHQSQTDIAKFKAYLDGYKVEEVGGRDMLVPHAGKLTCDLLFSREAIDPEQSSRRFAELGRISAGAYANVGADLGKILLLDTLMAQISSKLMEFNWWPSVTNGAASLGVDPTVFLTPPTEIVSLKPSHNPHLTVNLASFRTAKATQEELEVAAQVLSEVFYPSTAESFGEAEVNMVLTESESVFIEARTRVVLVSERILFGLDNFDKESRKLCIGTLRARVFGLAGIKSEHELQDVGVYSQEYTEQWGLRVPIDMQVKWD